MIKPQLEVFLLTYLFFIFNCIGWNHGSGQEIF